MTTANPTNRYTDATHISDEDLQTCQDLVKHAAERCETVMLDTIKLMPHPVGAYMLIRRITVEFGRGFSLFSSRGSGGTASSELANVRVGMAMAMLEILAAEGSQQAERVLQRVVDTRSLDGRELCRVLSQLEL